MNLLYTAGTARGGTNLRTLLLNNHSRIRMSLDPFIPLFRFYRDSLLRAADQEHLLTPATRAVLDDYYFSETKIRVMQTLQDADPDIPFDASDWPRLKSAIASRMKLASVDLIPHLDVLPASTFREVFANTMRVVAATTSKRLVWVGFNDNWTAEFIPLVARLLPDAHFMVHVRDPRAVVSSSEFAEPDPAKRPTVLSFARHLRKHMALAVTLRTDPLLEQRLLITRYEPFLTDLANQTRALTDFLGVEHELAMMDVSHFRKADGTPWASDWPVYQASGDSWRTEMPSEMAELTEFVCDPEMRLFGYQPEVYDARSGLSDAAIGFARRNAQDCMGWRTDFAEIERTLGSELYRKRLLALAEPATADEIKRCFLFPEAYRQLQLLTSRPSPMTSVPT